MQNEVGALKLECRKLLCENSALKSQANSLETYSRRDNFIIHGIPEPDKESATQCEKSVKQFFVNHLNLTDQESTDIKFIRCHRLHTTRKVSVKPIIIRFKNFQDREKVWTKKTMIKDRKLNIAEDFPKSIAYNISNWPKENCGDRFFAVGLPITHQDILNQNVWNGESKLGEILMTVRNELNQDQ